MTEKQQDVDTQCSVNRDEIQGVRLRAIILGLLLAAAICAITPFNNAYRQGTPLGGGHFPLAPFFILIWLTFFAGFIPILMSKDAQIRFSATNIFKPGARSLSDRDLETIFLEKRSQDNLAGFDMAGKILRGNKKTYGYSV